MKTSTDDSKNAVYYTRLADTWWDKEGPLWPIHTLNALRVQYLRDWIVSHFALEFNTPQPLRGIKILDMGCGGGVLSESMARLGACVTGVDVVERNILVARQHAQQEGMDIDYHISNAETLIKTGRTYDMVLNMEVVEHVSDLHTFMHACNQLVKPDGLMFIATINRTFMAWLSTILGAEYILRWLPRGTHQWRKFRKPQELEVLLNQDHLHVLHRTGVMVNPVSRRMHLSSMTSINYMLVALKRNNNSAQHPLPVRQ